MIYFKSKMLKVSVLYCIQRKCCALQNCKRYCGNPMAGSQPSWNTGSDTTKSYSITSFSSSFPCFNLTVHKVPSSSVDGDRHISLYRHFKPFSVSRRDNEQLRCLFLLGCGDLKYLTLMSTSTKIPQWILSFTCSMIIFSPTSSIPLI